MDNSRVYKMSFAGVYPHYIQKAEKKAVPKLKWMKSFAGLQDILLKACKSRSIIKPILKFSLLKHRRSILMFRKYQE